MKLPSIGIAFAFGMAASAALAQPTHGGAMFRCGGVGQAEQEQFKAEAARHDVLITFASTAGAYLADVDFQVTAESGRVALKGRCEGPLMLVDIGPKGTYEIEATFNGNRLRQRVTLDAKPARLSFVWPVP